MAGMPNPWDQSIAVMPLRPQAFGAFMCSYNLLLRIQSQEFREGFVNGLGYYVFGENISPLQMFLQARMPVVRVTSAIFLAATHPDQEYTPVSAA